MKTQIFNGSQIWAATSEALQEMAYNHDLALEAKISMADFFQPREAMAINDDGIAQINVTGGLLDNPPAIHEKTGGTSYKTVIAEIGEAVAMGANGIFLNISSGGGSVTGLKECSNAILECGLPTMAHCDGVACSAAYYLASSANEIAASPSALVGNIGTIMSWQSGGALNTEVITNEGADLKSTFKGELSETQREFLQAQADGIGEDFKDHVMNTRDGINAEVFRAGWYSGEMAEELDLVDGIATKSQAMEIFRGELNL